MLNRWPSRRLPFGSWATKWSLRDTSGIDRYCTKKTTFRYTERMSPSIFSSIKTIAVVGISDKPDRPSYQVAVYLQEKGFTIIPINPLFPTWRNIPSYPSLADVPKSVAIDAVDIFRKSEFVLPIVQTAIKRGNVKTIWMQEGVENKEAEELAKSHGLTVISNMCMMKAHKGHG